MGRSTAFFFLSSNSLLEKNFPFFLFFFFFLHLYI